MASNEITGRIVSTHYLGSTINGNPMLSVDVDEYMGAGVWGIPAIPRSEAEYHCYECRRSWSEETPAGRCPWGYYHGEVTNVRVMNDSGLVYGIDNPEYKDHAHTFILTPAGRIRNVRR